MNKCVKCGNEILTGDIHWEMGLCNNCYNELYKDHKTHISLDKMWLKLAQDFRDENEKLQDKVANLEAKLTESEKKNFELVAKIKLKEHTPAFCTLADGDCEALGKIAELQKQLAEKDKAIENWQTIYESVVQTCHNDKEEIERLNKRLETQENTITNLVEDNRASQEWYKKQLKEKDKEIEYQESMKILAVENQNKKAIEQLEKVKEWCENHKFSDEYDYVIAYEEDEEDASGCEDYFKDYIDNQIKQLKEMK